MSPVQANNVLQKNCNVFRMAGVCVNKLQRTEFLGHRRVDNLFTTHSSPILGLRNKTAYICQEYQHPHNSRKWDFNYLR